MGWVSRRGSGLILALSLALGGLVVDLPPGAGAAFGAPTEIGMLREKAAREGLVRVIVEVRPAPDAARAKDQLRDLMADSGTAALIQPLEDLPLVPLEVTAEGFDRLLASGLVARVEEDSPHAPQ